MATARAARDNGAGEDGGEPAGEEAGGEGGLEDVVFRREQVAELVGEAGEDGADGGGGKLIEVRGDDAPGALDHELHQEAAEAEEQEGVGSGACGGDCGWGPEGDHGDGEEGGDGDGAAAAEALGEGATGDAAGEGAEVAKDSERPTGVGPRPRSCSRKEG